MKKCLESLEMGLSNDQVGGFGKIAVLVIKIIA